uniref:Kelch domain containing 1 n=1 Tax=Sinocyclocheilus grahami TaxID=75366 RepID=A0A672PUE4_SINGR
CILGNTLKLERRDMSGTCGCIVNEERFIFGGCCDDGQTNEVKLHSVFTVFRCISKATRESCGSPDRIIYFGGYGHKPLSAIHDPESFIVDEASWAEDIFWGWNNEVHEFDPERSSWTEPQTFGSHSASKYMSVCLKQYEVLLCVSSGVCRVGLGLAPVGRSWHTLTAVSDTPFSFSSGDGWMFNLETEGWTEMEHQNKDKPRLWHTACQGRDSDVVVFGGSHDFILLVDKGHCNEALVFQTPPLILCQDFIASHTGMFQYQILCLPPKLRNAVHKRTIFFRERERESCIPR